ncbi:restriction endonuclease subunit S [Bifidobacterium adolescentis]|nr:restriction endonuclease subunit S [Bifidobacterium adolescentis]
MAEQHEKALVPQIRFTGFTDPWEQRKLGEVARRVTRKNENGDSDLPLTISAQYGLVDQRTFFNSQVASKDMSGYFLLHRGEFAYNKSTSTDSPWGAIKRLEKYDMGCVSTLYICFELLSGDPDFLVTYYETDRWYKSVQLIAAEGARNHGLLNIAPDDFFETQICIPKRIDEQRRIGAFFDRLDSLITLHQGKYDKLCVLKKSMLDKMFPKGGSLYPEIRFAGFTDPWEQRKLGEVARRVTRKNENGDSDLPLTISAQYGLVDQRTFFNSQVASKDMSGYFLLHRGEFAYNKSTSTDSPWGAIKRLEKYDMGCVSTLYICFELLSGDPDFLVTYYETDRWYKSVQLIAAEGARNHGLLNIAPDDFFETQICIPKRIDEQRRIGAFFDRLDSLITLHQRKLELLRNIKKSMLDKMFV